MYLVVFVSRLPAGSFLLTNRCRSLEVTQVNGNRLGKDMLSKMKTSVVVAALLLAVSAYANDAQLTAPKNSNDAVIQASLSELPAVEIPVKAGELLKAASNEAKLETAKAILKNVLEQRPQMAIQLVASLVKASPESASQISTFALAIVPQYGAAIIKVAAASAPQFADQIAVDTVRSYPSLSEHVVNWVSLVVPSKAASVEAAVERQTKVSEYVRMISAALAQSSTGGGTIASTKATLSSIIVKSPTLRAALKEGLQAQVNDKIKAAQDLAASQANKAGNTGAVSVEVVEKEVSLVFNELTGIITIVETIKSKKTLTYTPGVGTPTETPVALTEAEKTPEVIEITPTETFPDPATVEVQQGVIGSDTQTRLEDAAQKAIAGASDKVKDAYGL
jgi:hypothetical protein